ncbi:copper-transporting ATPase [Scheffersomyces coipomensis]|uniref:copper-transporting ATPase n=1 Tax=Scheffersomyces coipomensis TaxID=1788519 RepID=UPI00315D1564
MSATVLFHIRGMTCAACTSSIQESLSHLSGVAKISISLLTEEGKILFDPSQVNLDQIKSAIEDCGFDATMIKSNIPLIATSVRIDGMTCGSCSASITEALEKINGIDSASVSLVTESGLIKHTNSVSVNVIKQAIENCGFDVTIESSKSINHNSDTEVDTSFNESKFEIQGMTCGACSASITEALENTSHIEKVSVSLLTGEALVQHSNDVTIDQIIEIIENCGFDAKHLHTNILSSSSNSNSATQTNRQSEEDEISLQIYGINNETDLTHLQYNIEAYLNSSPGIHNFHIAFKELLDRSNAPLVTDANSQSIAAIRSEDEINNDGDNLIDELSISFNPNLVGVRDLVDGLDGIAEQIQFVIVNSIDQSSATQLKLLSRIKEINYWRNNFLQCLGFGFPILLMSYTQNNQFWKDLLIFPGLYWVSLLQFILAVHVQFRNGATFNKKFISFVKNGGRNATMDVLVCISSSVSFLFSIISIILSVWYGQENSPPTLLFDTSSMLILFISFGKWLENKAKGATSTALSKLLSLTPTNCTIINDTDNYEKFLEMQRFSSKQEKIINDKDDGSIVNSMENFSTRNISIDLVQTNDIAVVLPGGKIPADGVIVFGESEINESFITGETLPVHKKRGNKVIGGSINGLNLIHIRVLKTGKKSQLQQIISLVKESQINKAPIQRFSDYIAARFVPCVLVLAITTFIFWLIICYINHIDTLPQAFTKEKNGKYFVCLKIAISVIVVACPCALGLAAPTAVMVGTGVGAQNGVLIKGADILEKASGINIILFDKTGTLTTGDMKLANYKMILNNSQINEQDWWTIVGSVENNSEHPVGRAITKAAKSHLNLNFEEDVFNSSISDFKVLTGLGISANIQVNHIKYQVLVGNIKVVEQMFPQLISQLETSNVNKLNTVSYVVINGEYFGYLELSDHIKENSFEIIQYLSQFENYQIGMVTGDSKEVAERIGQELGIASFNIFSQVSPIHKDKVIVDLKQRLGGEGNVGIAFVGDGINDAPALAQADIGMAISSGTDIAIESADVVLIGSEDDSNNNDLIGVLNALHISNATFRRIKINFAWAAIYNMIMLPFAMGCFLPFNVILPPIAAACAMMLSSVSVVISSLALKNWKSPKVEDEYRSFKIDMESISHDVFNLKDGTIEEFNMVKRNNSRSVRNRRRYNVFNYIKSAFNFGSSSSSNSRQYVSIPSS